jgi:hypothetical protein
VARDVDFRRWLFGYGSEVLIESPQGLRDTRLVIAERTAELYPG